MSDTVDVKRVLDMAGELISTLKRNHMDEWTEVLQALVVVLNRKSVSLSGTIYLHDIFEVIISFHSNRLQLETSTMCYYFRQITQCKLHSKIHLQTTFRTKFNEHRFLQI